MRDAGHGRLQSWSPKVFIPLTQLCRDLCHYCTFSRPPERGAKAYLTRDDVLEIARAGQRAGCTEALFTLGEKPELRHRLARKELDAPGHDTTLSYLAEMCATVIAETGLLPHVNAGTMSRDEMAMLRRVSVSQGLMLESTAERLCAPGGPHYRSPDKAPSVRLETIRIEMCIRDRSQPVRSNSWRRYSTAPCDRINTSSVSKGSGAAAIASGSDTSTAV